MIYYAPVLPAEKWTSIDRYAEHYIAAATRYTPDLKVTSLLPSSEVKVNKWKKRFIRDISYPKNIKKAFQQAGDSSVLHVFDHAYAHLCKASPKSILHCHDLNHFVEPSLTGIQLERWKKRVMGMKDADHVIAISHQLSGEIQKYIGIPEGKISVVYNGLDHENFRPNRMEEAINSFPKLAKLRENHFLVLNVGTNLERKNLETLYGAIKRLQDKNIPVKLVRVGTNESREGESERIKEFGIKVIQMGVVSTEKVALLYNLCHVLSFPSLYEGFGWPLVEAQACGLPLVATDSSCIPEIAREGAFYHEPKSEADLASKLEIVFQGGSEVGEIKGKGLENVERFSWERHMNELSELYISI